MASKFNSDEWRRKREEFRTQRTQQSSRQGGGERRNKFGSLLYRTFNLKDKNTNGRKTWIRMHPYKGPDEPFKEVYSRWVVNRQNGKRSEVISNSQAGALDVPDLLLLVSSPDDPQQAIRPKYCMSITVLDYFHESTPPAKNGKIPQYKNYARCAGTNTRGQSLCEQCNERVPRVFGRELYLSLSYAQREKLLDRLHDVQNRCSNCSKGRLQTAAIVCPNSDCGAVWFDAYDKNLSDSQVTAQLEAMRDVEFECGACGQTGVGARKLECLIENGADEVSAGCDNPTELATDDIFALDYLLSAHKGPEQQAPIEFNVHRWRPSSADTRDKLHADALAPLPLDKFLSYMPLSQQAKLIGLVPGEYFSDADEQALEDFFSSAESREVAGASEDDEHSSVSWGDSQDYDEPQD